MKNLRAHALRANMSSLIRRDTLDGRSYIVCPTILINEGVYNGVFYPSGELSKHPDAWNGRPLVLGHPTVRGKPVTANSKKVKETLEIGCVLNANWDDDTKTLKAESWIDEEKARTRAPHVLKALEDEEGMDVSTGLFTDDDMRANSFNGKDYDCIARNHRPDHLAILPDSKGACSWNDGAGLPRINEAADGDVLDGVDDEPETCPECDSELDEDGECPECKKDVEKKTGDGIGKADGTGLLKKEDVTKINELVSRFCTFFGLRNNEDAAAIVSPKLGEGESLQERLTAISTAFREMNSPDSAWGTGAATPSGIDLPWIEDVYDTWFTYRQGDKTYRRSYTWDTELGELELTGEPEEVFMKKIYVPKANGAAGSGNQFLDPCGSEQQPTWAQQEGSPQMDKPMKVNTLIQKGHLDASLRETMLAAPEAVLMAFDQLAIKANSSRPKTLEEAVEMLPEEEAKKAREAIAAEEEKKKKEEEEKETVEEEIKGNSANKLTAAQLKALSLDVLRGIQMSLPKSRANHAAAAPGGVTHTNAEDDAAPEMPTIDDALKANAARMGGFSHG